jgi:hypothetical protein
MGQVASRRRDFLGNKSTKTKHPRKYSLKIWRQVKDAEITQLQGKMRKQIACQSFLIKEIFEDRLREQRENHKKEIGDLKKEIAYLQNEILKMKS